MSENIRLIMVVDADGNVLAAHRPVGGGEDPAVGLAALPGQTLHEVDVPAHLAADLTNDLRPVHGYRLVGTGLVKKEGE